MNAQTQIVNNPVDNGVNVAALLDARAALTEAPVAAQFQWRATCDWVDGTQTRATIENFFGLGEELKHRKVYDFDMDHPEVFAAKDNGVTPVEYILVGLAGCLTAGVASVAQHRGIQINKMQCRVEGDMDIQGILGIDKDVRNGYSGIKVIFDIDADASQDDIEAVVAQSQKRSAVYDVVTNPCNVQVEVR
jgi:uncharacterized OsmC-like protein